MLKNLLFTMILVVGCSLIAFGQSNDGRNPTPPKEKPPVVPIKPKPTPTPTPPKKPQELIEANLQGMGKVEE